MKAGPADDWSELMKSVELNPWMMAKLQAKRSRSTISARASCSNSCRRGRTSCGQSSWQMKDREGSHRRTCAHTVNAIRLKTTSGGSRRRIVTAARARRSSVTGGARLVAHRRDPTQNTASTNSANPSEAKVFRAHASPKARAKFSWVLSKCKPICRRAGKHLGHDLCRFAGAEQVENHE